jgi:protein-tyrosine-phosphatase
MLAKEMLQEAELVVVMDMRNADSLLRLFPESERKTILLNALVCQGEPEIADPYGMPLPAGAVAYSQIDTALVALARNLTLSVTPAGLTESCA